MTGPRDWDKELAEIDKVIAGSKAPVPTQAALPAPAGRAVSAPAAAPAAAVATRSRDKFAVWFRTVLGAAAAAALPFWPYAKSCGTMLYLYLFAALAVVVAGIWAMRGSWTHRRGVAHVGGLFVLLAGISFIVFEVFQRTAFAAGRLGWTCP